MTFEALDNQSPIWAYQADRALTNEEKAFILKEMAIFFDEWESHGEKLHGAIELVDNYNLIIGVKQPEGKMCGGSVDSLFRFLKSMGTHLKVDFFNRLKVVTVDDNKQLEVVPFFQLENFPNRLMFNLSVKTKEELLNGYKIQVKDYLTSLV
jgi:hypothetical protein